MSIVLNETEWARRMIESCDAGKKPTETFRRVARYYMDNGYSATEARKQLDVFAIKCNIGMRPVKLADLLDRAVAKASKCPSINIDEIHITVPEMERIKKLEGKQLKRLAFTLLCLAKYWLAVSPEKDCWVNTEVKEIMALANINTSIKRQCFMQGLLREEGLIQFSKKVDNTNIRVCFIEEGDIALTITDFRNLGYQCLKYYGDPYFECANCGIVTKATNPGVGRKQKYCKKCASEVAIQQRINYIMRHTA